MSNKFIAFKFDDKGEAAAKAAEQHAAEMITNITAETQANIRNLIARAIRDGIPPYQAADAIHDMIGLNASQGQAAMKYREQLEESGLNAADVSEKTSEYVDELLDARAEMIVRTEVMDALNEGQDEAWQQAQEDGLLTEDATKEWILTPDDAICPDCEEMDGATVPIGEDFPDGDPPLHPNCRCTIGIGKP